MCLLTYVLYVCCIYILPLSTTGAWKNINNIDVTYTQSTIYLDRYIAHTHRWGQIAKLIRQNASMHTMMVIKKSPRGVNKITPAILCGANKIIHAIAG